MKNKLVFMLKLDKEKYKVNINKDNNNEIESECIQIFKDKIKKKIYQ